MRLKDLLTTRVKRLPGNLSSLAKPFGINWPGAPEHVFHGSHSEIQEFDKSKLGDNTGAHDAHIGFHFSDNRADADFYAQMAADQIGQRRGYIGKYKINMQRPMVVTPFVEDGNLPAVLAEKFLENKIEAKKYAQKAGYDGIIYPHGSNVDSGWTAIAFEPEQIRVAK